MLQFTARFAGPATTPLRQVIEYAQTGPFGTQLTADEYIAGGVPVINPTHIQRGRIAPDDSTTVTPEKAEDLARYRLAVGDIVLGRKGEVDKSALVNQQNEGYVCGSDAMALRPRSGTVPNYLWWFLQSSEAHSQLEFWSVGTTVSGLNQNTIRKVRLPLPDVQEQQRIADYLDRETARIDTLIEEQQCLIEILVERRQAVIDESFSTLGEPGVQLRRYIKFLTSGSRGWGDYYADQGERFLRIGNLPRANLEIRGDIQFVDLPADVTEGSRTMLQEGDLLFSITAYLGSVAVVEGDWVGAYVSQHVALCRLERDQVDPRFIGWFMLTTTGQDQLNKGAAGGTKIQLALDDIRGLWVPTAPIVQQRRIAAHLDWQTAKIDAMVAETERFVELARERRAALITAALTGQIDVREIA